MAGGGEAVRLARGCGAVDWSRGLTSRGAGFCGSGSRGRDCFLGELFRIDQQGILKKLELGFVALFFEVVDYMSDEDLIDEGGFAQRCEEFVGVLPEVDEDLHGQLFERQVIGGAGEFLYPGEDGRVILVDEFLEFDEFLGTNVIRIRHAQYLIRNNGKS